jgi:phage/plasmid-like protein (TIGR03299 family)
MSKETLEWLNNYTLIGHTDKRGTAWHYRKHEQGGEPNHYPQAIPVADVERRLFNWDPEECALHVPLSNGGLLIPEDRKAIVRPADALFQGDPGAILGLFKSGYRVHGFQQWLVENVETILDDELSIGSAGLLKGGAVAWVSVEVPDSIKTPEGVLFRPNLIAATSLDGSLATTYQRCVTNVVCDNTMSAALGESPDQRVKIKHSVNSLTRLEEVRSALGIVYSIADDFAAEVATLCETKVSEGDWEQFLDSLVPVKDEKGKEKVGKGLTMANNKRDALCSLYFNDDRCAPWNGSAWGVIQTVNTFAHHEQIVRGKTDKSLSPEEQEEVKKALRAQRNQERAVNGLVDALDLSTLETLQGVLA